jgi:lipid-binding SYLF domain-containing protein
VRGRIRRLVTALVLTALAGVPAAPRPASAGSAEELSRNAVRALDQLCATNTSARLLRDHAVGILVFPTIVKAGFMFGGQIGEGALLKNGRTAGYYNSVAASYGLQAGIQAFGYALFFMNQKALAYLDKSAGFEIGVGPSIVVVDEGIGKSLTSTTITQDVYAFIFDQQGLMAGVGIQGSKITKIRK